jgi:hypothetical protein
VEFFGLCIADYTFIFAQRCKIRHDILDLFGRQDRLAPPCLANSHQSLKAIKGRHDRRGIEAGAVDQPKPELAFGPTAAGAGEAGREITLKFLFRKWPAMAKDASAGAINDQRAAPRRITRHARQRFRNGIADHNIWPQSLRAGRRGQGERRRHEPRASNRDG